MSAQELSVSVLGAGADHPHHHPMTQTRSLPSSTGIREAERFGTPPGRASSVPRAGKEESGGSIKYKAGRVSAHNAPEKGLQSSVFNSHTPAPAGTSCRCSQE